MKLSLNSIKTKIVFSICIILVLSQGINFVATYLQVNSSQEHAVSKFFGRTEYLVETLFKNQKQKLESQALLVSNLPILMAVVGSDDSETIKNTEQEYKQSLEIDFFDVITFSDLENIEHSKPQWDRAFVESMVNKIDEGENQAGFSIRAGKLVLVATTPIGNVPNNSGYLIAGINVDAEVVNQIARLSDAEITFLVNNKVVATSLKASLSEQTEWHHGNSFSTNDHSEKQDIFRDSDYIYKKLLQQGLDKSSITTLVLQSSLKENNKLFLMLVLITLGISLAISLIFALVGAKIGETISRPIQNLEKVANSVVSSLDFKTRAEVAGKDEVGSLATSFNHLLAEIQTNHEKLEEYNKNLSQKVEERTETINTILNNVESGFCLVNEDLIVEQGYTRSCNQIIGEDFASERSLADLLKLNDREKDHFNTCYKEVFEDFMPESVTLGQSPKSATIGEKTIGLSASAIRNSEEKISHLLFNINDISQLIKAQQTNDSNQALLKIISQKDAFVTFLIDLKSLIAEAETLVNNFSDNEKRIRIILHTVKGNCGALGLISQADLIHQIEDKEEIKLIDIQEIEDSISDFVKENKALGLDFDNITQQGFQISSEKLSEILTSAKNSGDLEELQKHLQKWISDVQQQPAATIFSTISDLVKRVSERLMKEVAFNFEGDQIMVDPQRFNTLAQVMPHVIRNCLDHGIEDPSDRGEKDPKGHLNLIVSEQPDHWEVIVSDDGRGIDSSKLVEKALKNGQLSPETVENMKEEEKLRLIFEDGLSTAESVSDVSGRGVGMAAVLEAVTSSGGELILKSDLGKGTTFQFIIPKSASVKGST